MRNKKTHQPLQDRIISIREIWDLHYWTRTLHATRAEIEEAMHAVGNSVKEIRSYLNKK
jgi:hypothetical protein